MVNHSEEDSTYAPIGMSDILHYGVYTYPRNQGITNIGKVKYKDTEFSTSTANGSRVMDYFYQRYESHTPTPMERAGRLGEQIQALIAGGAAVYNEITPGAYRDFIGSRSTGLTLQR